MIPTIIDIDQFKLQIPEYDPSRADLVHTQSAKMADKAFEDAVKRREHEEVILLCGGSASGKTEFINSFLKEKDAIIFDSTLSSNAGVKYKVRISRKHYKISVVFIQPKNIILSFLAFKQRPRKFPAEHFIRTHAKSRETFLFVLEKYDTINCVYFVSSVDIDNQGKMIYEEIEGNRQILIEKIENQQLSEEEILKTLTPFI